MMGLGGASFEGESRACPDGQEEGVRGAGRTPRPGWSGAARCRVQMEVGLLICLQEGPWACNSRCGGVRVLQG